MPMMSRPGTCWRQRLLPILLVLALPALTLAQPHGTSASLLQHWNGSTWLGNETGLFRLEADGGVAIRIDDIGAVRALQADAQALLVLDAHALWRVERDGHSRIPLSSVPLQLLPAALECTCWWLLGADGLALLQRIGERWTAVDLPAVELAADSRLLLDDGEALWLQDSQGLQRLPTRALLAGQAFAPARWPQPVAASAADAAGTHGLPPAGGSGSAGAAFWLGASSSALLAMALALVYRIESARRERRLVRQRQEELDRQVQRRTADLEIANRQLRDLADTDALTGVSNRRHFDRLLREGFERALLTQRPLSVLMLDADHFKRYNDEHGHLAGDQALRALGQCLQGAVRSDTVVARFGGEEFAVITPSGRRDARGLAERLRRLVERDCPTTVSIGVATLASDLDRDEPALLARADRALYSAKASGRNRVASADEPMAAAKPTHQEAGVVESGH